MKRVDTLVFAVHVAVIYLLFLIFVCIVAVVLTIIIQRLHNHSETKPLAAMPIWVSTNMYNWQYNASN